MRRSTHFARIFLLRGRHQKDHGHKLPCSRREDLPNYEYHANAGEVCKNVALVDADLRRSMISAKYTLQFDVPEEKYGLSHMLAGMVEEDQVLYQTNIPGAYMVPVGREVSNPLPLLNSPRLAHLLNYLAQRLDYVLVDAPPVGAVIDAAQIAKNCDGTLIVVNYNSVRRQELLDVKEQLEQTGCPILGTVLNMVEYDNYLSKKILL